MKKLLKWWSAWLKAPAPRQKNKHEISIFLR